ncbi:MAG: hypothetical protein OSJ63_07225, partial [Bacilli bacterium]|nr:hypothetical protein [Bacilli bacterium]
MKKNIMTLGAITVLGSGLFLFSMYEKKLLNREEITNNKSIAIYIKQEDGNYEKTNTIPESGYILNEEKSVCSNNSKPSWNFDTKSLKINNLNKNSTSCYLYFDSYCKPEDTACKTILANKEVKSRDKIAGALTENTTGKIYVASDEDGSSFYFAGDVDNNWVYFANNYWRIIRINGDGSVRMIYNGPTTGKTDESTKISSSFYSVDGKRDDSAYVGYMFGTPGSNNYQDTHANINDSAVKTIIDNWYKDNILNLGFDNYVSKTATFCNDRSITEMVGYGTLGYGDNITAYSPRSRMYKLDNTGWLPVHTPTLHCAQKNDIFTTNMTDKGNNKLTYPVGLITLDEAIFAGGFGNIPNNNYYLYTGYPYWTMSPCSMDTDGFTYISDVTKDGAAGGTGANWNVPGVRPVINLKANVTLTGTG